MQSSPRSKVAKARPTRRSAVISSVRVTTIFTGGKKNKDRGLRNDQRICLPPPQLLLVALPESHSLLLGISVGDVDTRTFPQPYVSLTMYVLQPGCSSETLQQDLLSLLSAQLNKPNNLRCTSQHLGYGRFLETFTSLCV